MPLCVGTAIISILKRRKQALEGNSGISEEDLWPKSRIPVPALSKQQDIGEPVLLLNFSFPSFHNEDDTPSLPFSWGLESYCKVRGFKL